MKLTPLSKRDIKALNKSKGVLIVDDILDSGDTVVEVYEYLSCIGNTDLVDKTEFFSIVTKDYTEDEFCVYNLTGDERWVVFPWDK
jgi:hypoxanthine phosphoribosyltransferase